MTSQSDFIPLQTLQRALRWWWMIVLLMLAGAAGGWGVHFAVPPVYQARTAITTSIEFGRTGELTDIEEDQAIITVGDVIKSSTVLEETLIRATSEGIYLDMETFKENIFWEREAFRWTMRVVGNKPEETARLADLWAETAMDALQNAQAHAVQAEGLYRYLASLESCLEQAVAAEPVYALCRLDNLAGLQSAMQQTGEAARREDAASLGILPAMSFAWSEKATVPTSPSRFNQAGFILGGAMLGLVAAIFAMETRLFEHMPGAKKGG